MNAISLQIYIQMFLASLPVLIVCLGACVVIICKWKSGAPWLLWALFGFGLGLFIAIGGPISQAVVQSLARQSGDYKTYAWVFPILGVFWSVMHACAYALLFIAVFEGRK